MTTVTRQAPRVIARVKQAVAEMNHAQRRLFEFQTELPYDARRRVEIERLDALYYLKPRI